MSQQSTTPGNGNKNLLVWLIVFLTMTGFVTAVLFVTTGSRTALSTPPTSAAASVETSPPDAVPVKTPEPESQPQTGSTDQSQNQAGASDGAGTPPDSSNCHDTDFLARAMHKSAETRAEFAQASNETLGENDLEGIETLAKGDDKEHLLFVGTPESEARLSEWASTVKSDPEIQARFCLEGFADVQFIVRDQNLQQTLVDKIETDPGKTFIYLNQRYGATPMQ